VITKAAEFTETYMNLCQTTRYHMPEESYRQSASQISVNIELCQAISFVSLQSYLNLLCVISYIYFA